MEKWLVFNFLVKIKVKIVILNKLSIGLFKLWIVNEEKVRLCDIRSFGYCFYFNFCSSLGVLSYYFFIG